MARPYARLTHSHDGELVVFAIGMQPRKIWRPDKWLPVFLEMPRILAELSEEPDSGLLGYRLAIGVEGPWLLQYWSSQEKLYAYASDPNARHRPAWAAFNRRARSAADAVGIWHETYVVDRAESIYGGMKPGGLAKATAAVPVGPASETARARLARSA